MDNSLLRYSAKDHFFRAALCHLCVDFLNAQIAIQKYQEMFPTFSDSRECKLVKVDMMILVGMIIMIIVMLTVMIIIIMLIVMIKILE